MAKEPTEQKAYVVQDILALGAQGSSKEEVEQMLNARRVDGYRLLSATPYSTHKVGESVLPVVLYVFVLE